MLLDRGHRLRAPAHRVHLRGRAAERVDQDVAGRGVVVHHQRAEVHELGRDQPAGLRAHPEPGREDEGAAHAGLALQPDLPAHQLHEPERDRQAEAGASVLAGGGHVRLGEGLEELADLLRGHADAGVPDREAELHLLAGLLQAAPP